MDTVRYYIALLTLMTLPASIGLWLVIHPFASFWRRLGPGWTYGLLAVPFAALMWGVYLLREPLLAVDFGTSYPLMAVAILPLGASMALALKRRRLLTFGVLAGLPELSRKRGPGVLLAEGLYARLRHPRYVEVVVGILGYALITNYLAMYIATALTVPALYLVVVLEERELHARFGEAYEDYCRRVPRFVPRRQR